MADYRDLVVRIKGDTGGFEKSMSGVTGEATKAENSLGKLTAAVGLGNLGYAAFTKTLSLAKDFISGSFKAYEQQELAVTRLEAGIKNVKSATDKSVDSLIKQAQALQKTTRFSDEQIESAQGILTTFQLNQKQIQAITPRLIDMAEGIAKVSGSMPDLETNAMLIAKAIGGEDTEGLTGALRRNGVQFTKHQEELLKTGNMQDRLSTITEVLDQNFKDLGTAAGNTSAGKVAIFKNNVNDLQEKIGEFMAKALNPMLDLFNKHSQLIPIVTGAVVVLIAAIMTAKAITAATVIFQALGGAIGFVGTMSGLASGAFTSMIAVLASPVTLVVAGAIADLVLLVKAVQSVTDAFEAMNNARRAQESLAKSSANVHQTLLDLQKNGTPDQKARAGKAIAAGLASGGPVTSGKTYLVGEEGPELFTPDQSGGILPNDKLGGGVNLTVNVGMYAGMPVEKREIALSIYKEIVRAARAQGVSMPMIGAVGVQ